MKLRFLSGLLMVALWVMPSGTAMAQGAANGCGTATVLTANSQPNIFSEQQEEWLGDAMADSIEGDFKLARDSSQNAHLQAIVDRLAAQLPDSKIKFRVLLIESPEVNGFSIAGGHIYITRRLAASAASDDELAAVLGHEIGHIASHQFAFEITKDLKRLLNVTSVGDRADVYDKYQKLMTAWLRDKHPSVGDSDDKQDEADRLGMYVISAAGYRPHAMSEFWDRVFFVKGKTGGKVSDFFGLTKPTEKRLRGMLQMAAALPAGCGGTYKSDQKAFELWRAAVTANQAGVKDVAVEGATQRKLEPPLRMDLWYLRFSRDGKMVLAQDGSSVFVLGTEPFAPLVRFDAENALEAQFSPDMKRVVFSTPSLHTEEWSIADEKIVAAHEPNLQHECLETKLSPDGRTLVCVSLPENSSELMLELVDVETGKVVYTKKPFFAPSASFFYELAILHGVQAATSIVPVSTTPDGNTMLIGPANERLAIDLRTRTPISIGGELKAAGIGAYAFVADNRLAQVDLFNPKNSGLVSFPDGRMTKKIPFTFTDMRALSNDDGTNVLLATPLTGFKWGVADLDSGKFMLGVRSDAVDERNGVMVLEGTNGNVAMGKLVDGKMASPQQLTLPQSPLGSLATSSISQDGQYVAMSSKTRGAIWDTETGKQVMLLRGFKQSSWGEDGKMYAQFTKVKTAEELAADIEKAKSKDKPKPQSKDERVVNEQEFVGQVSPAQHATNNVGYKLDNKKNLQFGRLMEWESSNNKKTWKLTMHRVTDDSVMWTKDFIDGVYRYTESYGEKDLIFNFPTSMDSVKAKLKQNAALAEQASSIKHKDLGRLIEVVNEATGKTEAELVLELPLNFSGTGGLNRAGDLLYVTGEDNRTMVYSFQTGKEVRQFFGSVVAVDPLTGRVCTVNRRDEAVVYDAAGKELAHYHLGDTLKFAHFKNDGKQMVFVTADQTLWTTTIDAVQTAAK
jgi:hypothetical protein